jgi:hypothetical protein
LILDALTVVLWTLVAVPVIYWALGVALRRRGATVSEAGDWLALLLCGGFGVLAPLLRDATDGTPLFIFHSWEGAPGPAWATVFNALIAAGAAARLWHRHRLAQLILRAQRELAKRCPECGEPFHYWPCGATHALVMNERYPWLARLTEAQHGRPG